MISLPVIVLGAGGHAKVLIEALRTSGVIIQGITDKDVARHGKLLMSIPIIGDDEMVQRFTTDSILLVNAVGTTRVASQRRELFERFKMRGYCFATVVHASAVVASDTLLGEGAQIMAGAVLQPGVQIGENTIVNTRATIDHDCIVGNHAHISPGAILCGDVSVADNAYLGAGATIIQGIRVGRNSMVAAGAVVVRDVLDGEVVVGVPGRARA